METKGYVLYQGASAINGDNIVAVLTLNSVNRKTGPMAQLWILPADIEPLIAIKTGKDEAVCGQCAFRQYLNGICYVNVSEGPTIVWRAWKKGTYPVLGAENYSVLKGKAVRFGAFGDPFCLPVTILTELKKQAVSATAYTHQWKNPSAQFLKSLAMASVDNAAEYKTATAHGWRTFRVVEPQEPLMPREILCPNSTKGVQCIQCRLCAGTSVRAKNIAIVAHGTHKLKFNIPADYFETYPIEP